MRVNMLNLIWVGVIISNRFSEKQQPIRITTPMQRTVKGIGDEFETICCR
jgi:hypothetical protein